MNNLPLQDGTLPLHTPLLHVKVSKPNNSKPLKQEKLALAP